MHGFHYAGNPILTPVPFCDTVTPILITCESLYTSFPIINTGVDEISLDYGSREILERLALEHTGSQGHHLCRPGSSMRSQHAPINPIIESTLKQGYHELNSLAVRFETYKGWRLSIPNLLARAPVMNGKTALPETAILNIQAIAPWIRGRGKSLRVSLITMGYIVPKRDL